MLQVCRRGQYYRRKQLQSDQIVHKEFALMRKCHYWLSDEIVYITACISYFGTSISFIETVVD